MTEIPEHLLKRSKAARGQGGDSQQTGDKPDNTPSAPAQAPTAQPAANFPNLDAEPEPAKPEPAFITASKARKRIPVWTMAIMAALPIWAVSYAGTMQLPETEDHVYTHSAELYSINCAGCHGATGAGGTGYGFADGEIIETFNDPVDHMAHVARGSAAIVGQTYGNNGRVAGGKGSGPMPPQLEVLTQLELELVVFYERSVLGGEETDAAYEGWIEDMRHRAEAGDDKPIDLDLLLSCANPDVTPGATGPQTDEEVHCPGPSADGEQGEH